MGNFCSNCGHVCNETCNMHAKQPEVNWDLVAEAFKEIADKRNLKFDDKDFAQKMWDLSKKKVVGIWHGDGESGL